MDCQYRHEWKHAINGADLLVLRARLQAVMESDPHAIGGKYQIRSLYFDNLDDKALREKIDGVDRREKFRIRLYNGDAAVIRLEKKSRVNGLGTKLAADLTAGEARPDFGDGTPGGSFDGFPPENGETTQRPSFTQSQSGGGSWLTILLSAGVLLVGLLAAARYKKRG